MYKKSAEVLRKYQNYVLPFMCIVYDDGYFPKLIFEIAFGLKLDFETVFP